MTTTVLIDPVAEPVLGLSAFVVLDPHDNGLVHGHGGCGALSSVVDLVERLTGAAVDDPDAFDEALAGLGLVLPLHAAVGLQLCPECGGR